LSKLTKALLFLAKIENNQFEDSEKINFSIIVSNQIELLKDFIAEKSLTVSVRLEDNFILKSNYLLTESLATNLLGNAVRHSIPDGNIHIGLTNGSFRISNTGAPLKVPTEKLFNRFYKVNMTSDSPGLGLSIVNKICEVNNWKLDYKVENDLHTVTVTF
jgi:two-component system sensor histidine kinase QseC